MDDVPFVFRVRWTRSLDDLGNWAATFQSRLPFQIRTELSDVLFHALTTALRETESLDVILRKVAQEVEGRDGDDDAAHRYEPTVFVHLDAEFKLVHAAFGRAKRAKESRAALDCQKTLVDTLKEIVEKGNDKLPLGPWLALQFLGEAIDFAKALI